MSGETNIFDFDTAIYSAFQRLFSDNAITLVTPKESAQFQKDRARVEMLFQLGQAKQSYHIVNNQLRNASWFAQVIFQIITPQGETSATLIPVLDSSEAHREYRARVRNILSTAKDALNGNDLTGDAYLPFHEVQLINDLSTSPEYKPQDGIESSRMVYGLEFGIDQGAWVELTAA